MHFVSPAWLLLLIPVGRGRSSATSSCSCDARSTSPGSATSRCWPPSRRKRPGWRRHLTFALLLVGDDRPVDSASARPDGGGAGAAERATVMLAIDVSDVDAGHRRAADPVAGRAGGRQSVRRPAAAADQPRPGQVRRDARACWCRRPSTATSVKRGHRRSLSSIELHRDRRGDLRLPGRDQDVQQRGTTASGDKPRAGAHRADERRRPTPGVRPRPSAAEAAAAGQGAGVDDRLRHGRPAPCRHRGRANPGSGRQGHAARHRRRRPAGRSTRRRRRPSCRSVYKDIGSQIGYTTRAPGHQLAVPARRAAARAHRGGRARCSGPAACCNRAAPASEWR